MTSRQKEGFFNLANYPGDPISAGTRDIKTFFSETLPNIIFNNDKNINLQKITGTTNARTKTNESPLNNKWLNKINIPTGSNGYRAPLTSEGLSAKQAACESVGNGDQFDHLTSLASSEDTQARLRCGWVYNNTNPENGRGAYGNSYGAFNTNAVGTWTWNLDKAKEKFHTSICKNVQGCQDIDSSIYKQRCGWCTASGKAVPVTNGQVAYPYNTNTTCSPSQLVTRGSQCPAPPPVADPTVPRAPGEVCTPLANGALPRNCLLQKVVAAGCSDQGTLYQALQAGSDNNYTSALNQEQAYTIYQERATIPLNPTSLRSGKITIADALNDFKRVQDQSTSGANDGLQYAARDLCLNKGALNEFDLCSEIKDNQVGPFTLDCLQKAFLRLGGQKSGTAYPSQSTIAQWNAITTWGNVKEKVTQILAATQSKDRKTQEEGMMMFYGIKMQNKRNPLPYGPEIAWKDKKVVLSCDRPLPVPPGYTKAGCVSDSDNIMLDTWAAANGYTMGEPPQPKYTYRGCFNDCSQGRGLPNRLNNVSSIEQCKAQAIAAGYDTFGNQYYGECWAGNNTDWDKMGEASNCPPLGGGCNQHIYSTQPIPPPPVLKVIDYSGYTKRVNTDLNSDDNIFCDVGMQVDQCKSKCDDNPNCTGFNYDKYGLWRGGRVGKVPTSTAGCCLKASNTKTYRTGPNQHIDYYEKKMNDGLPNVKFVKIEAISEGSSWLNFSQLVVFNQNGENISVRRPTTGSPEWGGAPTKNAVDGNESARNFPGNSHSAGGGAFWQVTLDSPQTVTSVVVYNRGDCCQDRLAGYRIALLDSNSNVIWRSGALKTDAKQIVKVN